ncbi:MAG: neutral/alkaline non-lysosomal ceramidase N-terminal domain-containing protein [Candidatus Latescibacteria bacterium]|nr:neutral/alkaline non-lysosomal ceramidase N-terminal domain-containing protein [Candidatus Latescibacterota bacterium]
MALEIGIYRTCITPPWGVELAGLGYYLQRTWTRVRDDLKATALVACQGERAVALVAVDLMYMDAEFTRAVRQQVARHTDIPAEAVCVSASHSHNAPTAGFARGVGEQDLEYLALVRRQVATAAICAWQQRRPATLWAGRTHLEGMTFNRTRQGGAVDTQVSVLRADGADGRPFAVAVNFHAHPTVMMHMDNREVSRDYPGYMVDLLEQALPGTTAMFLQGSCGDVNFNMELWEAARCLEPGRALAGKALEALARARRVEEEGVGACSLRIGLPTRRYAREEVLRENEEGHYRLKSGDTTGWRETLGRVMVGQPDRFPERYAGDVGLAVRALARFAVEWTEEVLPDLDTRLETLETEVQALRFGDLYVAAHGSELFSSFSLDLRRRWPHADLMAVGYANDSLSYMPDAHDVERCTYAAAQSPKFTGHFPFVAESGERLVEGMLAALEGTLK